MCIAYEDGKLIGDDRITQIALDIHLEYGPFVLFYQGKVFDVVNDPTIDEQRAFFHPPFPGKADQPRQHWELVRNTRWVLR